MVDEGRLGENVHVRPRTCLSINIRLLSVLGIWFPEEEPKTWRSTAYIFYAIVTQGFLYHLFYLSETIQMLSVFGNLEKMIEVSFLLLTHLAQIWKLYVFYMDFGKMVKFLNDLELEIFKPANKKQEKILKWAMARARNDSVTLLSMAFVTCMLWGIFPFVEKTDYKRLPLSGWYPFDVTISPNYEAIFCYQIIGATVNAFTNIAMDTTATGLFVHVCGQIDMLKDSLENMKENSILSLMKKKHGQTTTDDSLLINLENDDYDTFTHEELEEEMQITYKKCVMHHQEIIRYAEGLEEIFNKWFLAQFSVGAIILCLTMLKLTMVQSIFSLESLSLILYQGCIFVELMLYCWHGNEMILKSDSVSNSIYNSKWYEFSPKFSRNIILLMVRSKRPLKATSGKFFPLSLPTLLGILKLSWSYFTVLNSMKEEEET